MTRKIKAKEVTLDDSHLKEDIQDFNSLENKIEDMKKEDQQELKKQSAEGDPPPSWYEPDSPKDEPESKYRAGQQVLLDNYRTNGTYDNESGEGKILQAIFEEGAWSYRVELSPGEEVWASEDDINSVKTASRRRAMRTRKHAGGMFGSWLDEFSPEEIANMPVQVVFMGPEGMTNKEYATIDEARQDHPDMTMNPQQAMHGGLYTDEFGPSGSPCLRFEDSAAYRTLSSSRRHAALTDINGVPVAVGDKVRNIVRMDTYVDPDKNWSVPVENWMDMKDTLEVSEIDEANQRVLLYKEWPAKRGEDPDVTNDYIDFKAFSSQFAKSAMKKKAGYSTRNGNKSEIQEAYNSLSLSSTNDQGFRKPSFQKLNDEIAIGDNGTVTVFMGNYQGHPFGPNDYINAQDAGQWYELEGLNEDIYGKSAMRKKANVVPGDRVKIIGDPENRTGDQGKEGVVTEMDEWAPDHPIVKLDGGGFEGAWRPEEVEKIGMKKKSDSIDDQWNNMLDDSPPLAIGDSVDYVGNGVANQGAKGKIVNIDRRNSAPDNWAYYVDWGGEGIDSCNLEELKKTATKRKAESSSFVVTMTGNDDADRRELENNGVTNIKNDPSDSTRYIVQCDEEALKNMGIEYWGHGAGKDYVELPDEYGQDINVGDTVQGAGFNGVGVGPYLVLDKSEARNISDSYSRGLANEPDWIVVRTVDGTGYDGGYTTAPKDMFKKVAMKRNGSKRQAGANIKTMEDLENQLADGPYAWPGGYPKFFIMADGGALCFKCMNENKDLAEGAGNEWTPVMVDINWEDPDLFCDNCSQRIESAYAEDGTDNKVEGMKMKRNANDSDLQVGDEVEISYEPEKGQTGKIVKIDGDKYYLEEHPGDTPGGAWYHANDLDKIARKSLSRKERRVMAALMKKKAEADWNNLSQYLTQRSGEICADNHCDLEGDNHNCESYAYINKDGGLMDICGSDYFVGSADLYAAVALPWSGTGEDLKKEVEDQTFDEFGEEPMEDIGKEPDPEAGPSGMFTGAGLYFHKKAIDQIPVINCDSCNYRIELWPGVKICPNCEAPISEEVIQEANGMNKESSCPPGLSKDVKDKVKKEYGPDDPKTYKTLWTIKDKQEGKKGSVRKTAYDALMAHARECPLCFAGLTQMNPDLLCLIGQKMFKEEIEGMGGQVTDPAYGAPATASKDESIKIGQDVLVKDLGIVASVKMIEGDIMTVSHPVFGEHYYVVGDDNVVRRRRRYATDEQEINDLERMKLRIEEQKKETEDESQMQALEQRLHELDMEIGKANAKQAMENPHFWDKVGEDIDGGNEKKLRSPATEEIGDRGHEEQEAHPSKGEPGEGTEYRHELARLRRAKKDSRGQAFHDEVQNAVGGYQINMMDISRVYQAAEQAFDAGQNVTDAVHALLDQIATKTGSRRMAGSKSQKKMIELIQATYPGMNPVPSEDFDGSQHGIWFRGGDMDINGLPVFNYYAEDPKEKTWTMGILNEFRDFLEKNGWFPEPYDPGTLMAYPDGPVTGSRRTAGDVQVGDSFKSKSSGKTYQVSRVVPNTQYGQDDIYISVGDSEMILSPQELDEKYERTGSRRRAEQKYNVIKNDEIVLNGVSYETAISYIQGKDGYSIEELGGGTIVGRHAESSTYGPGMENGNYLHIWDNPVQDLTEDSERVEKFNTRVQELMESGMSEDEAQHKAMEELPAIAFRRRTAKEAPGGLADDAICDECGQSVNATGSSVVMPGGKHYCEECGRKLGLYAMRRRAEEAQAPTLGGMPDNVEQKVDSGEAKLADKEPELDKDMFKSDDQIKMESNEDAVVDPKKGTDFDGGGFQSNPPFVGPSAMPGQEE